MTSPIAFALDFASVEEARAAAAEVAPAIGMLKVGLELFMSAGPCAVSLGRELSLPLFLDLKLHDIPETVERAVARASELGARIVTVHASGGREMLRRAVERAKKEGGTLDICAVTILTSLDDADLDDIGITVTRRLKPFRPEDSPTHTNLAAQNLARLAFDAGVRWFVCSPHEVKYLREALGPEATLVTPGVRPATSVTGDQKRVATPEEAIKNGANWLVVGRPIRDATNRLGAAKAIAEAAIRAGAANAADAANVANPT